MYHAFVRAMSCWVAIVFFVIAGFALVAQAAVPLEPEVFVVGQSAQKSLNSYLEYLDDEYGVHTIETIVQAQAGVFKRLTQDKKLGYNYPAKALWLRFAMDARHHPDSSWLLSYDYEHVGNLQVFYPTQNGYQAMQMDQNLPSEGRKILTRGYVFKLPTPSAAPTVYYIRLEPGSRFLRVNFSWLDTKSFAERLQLTELGHGLFFGALLIMLFYNAALYTFLRDRTYLFYIYYLACFILTFLHIYGFTALLMRLNFFDEQFFAAAGYGAMHGLVLFTRHFLSLKDTTPWLNRYLVFLQWVLVIGAVAAFFQPVGKPYVVLNVLILLIVPAAVFAGLRRLYQGYYPAKIYSMGWIVFALALAVMAARSLNLLPVNLFTDYAVGLASVWEAALFSIALGYRVNLARAQAVLHQKTALEAQKKAVEISQKSADEKTHFLGMIGHELKSPLQGILSALDVLELRKNNTDSTELVGRIRRASNALSIQLRDLLTFAQGEVGKLEMVPEPFEASELVQDVIDLYQDKAQNKGLALRMVLPQEPVYLVADATRISQVLNNLVSNAVKYTDKGEVTVTLYPYNELQGDFGFEVRDTGPGISPKFLPKLFEPYQRFAALEKNTEGTGIGLTIVQMVVTHLGGKINVQSQEGVGSVFEVRIAAVSAINDELEREPGTRHILIVDDRPDVLEGVASVVSQLGFSCDQAGCAATAANFLAACPFDLVLIDLDMPVKNGVALASETRRGHGPNKDAKLIAFSAANHADFGKTWPFDGFLQKPVTKETLRRLIESTKK
jgi:two-component system, sensor histidine kinase LadS